LTRRSKFTWTIILAALAAVAALFPNKTPGLRGIYTRHKLLQQIRLPDTTQRKQAAWAAINYPSPELADVMIRGLLDHEPDADVREAYAYALGNLGDPRAIPALERAVDTDDSGYVRCSAWLAAVRLDADHFETLAAAGPRRDDPWDRLGMAQARLSIGDARDLGVIFEQARRRDETRRVIAGRALARWLKPALDAAGRWPLEIQPVSGQEWPREWVDEIERRCATIEIEVAARETHAQLAASAGVRRNIMRINGAREELIAFLFGKRAAGQ
jgi:HEAT repeat protein